MEVQQAQCSVPMNSQEFHIWLMSQKSQILSLLKLLKIKHCGFAHAGIVCRRVYPYSIKSLSLMSIGSIGGTKFGKAFSQ